MEHAVLVYAAEIAGAIRALVSKRHERESLRRQLRSSEVAASQPRATDANLADLPYSHRLLRRRVHDFDGDVRKRAAERHEFVIGSLDARNLEGAGGAGGFRLRVEVYDPGVLAQPVSPRSRSVPAQTLARRQHHP
jgi:hypothetical protein